MPAAAENLLEVMQSDGWKFHRMICLTNSPSENNLDRSIMKLLYLNI
jgi:hypothetical protein